MNLKELSDEQLAKLRADVKRMSKSADNTSSVSARPETRTAQSAKNIYSAQDTSLRIEQERRIKDKEKQGK